MTAAVEPLLDIDPELFGEHFNRAPFAFQHRLSEHPLLQLDSLVDLAKRLPADQVRQARAMRTIADDLDASETTDRPTLARVLADLQHADRFLLLWHPETDPDYRRLLDSVLAEIRLLSEPVESGMRDPQGFISLTSPGSVTPYQMDREVNFLCQVRGTKVLRLWDQEDRTILSEEEIETLCADWTRPRPGYRPEYAGRAKEFSIGAGGGMHFPMFAPHTTTCGDGISIAMAITFRTRACERRMMIHTMNHRLRRHGRRPQPFGSPVADEVKFRGMQASLWLRRAAGR